MADGRSASTIAFEEKKQIDNEEIRIDLYSAFAFIEGQKSNQTFSAFTFEEANDRFIERIEGQGTALRPNKLEQIDRIVQRVQSVVARLQER